MVILIFFFGEKIFVCNVPDVLIDVCMSSVYINKFEHSFGFVNCVRLK